ncbi:hypothetical protein POM88_018597 [Heracleum sosnowskyi]|uniref:Uncharacterized protein n=1 Tax=Heracleum sosnowskyi TaxID=360622 RepID=A0AAD8IST3_9APIA|nr:hypothetical protein POM88_018597 [Heracleum sosnowskyi]
MHQIRKGLQTTLASQHEALKNSLKSTYNEVVLKFPQIKSLDSQNAANKRKFATLNTEVSSLQTTQKHLAESMEKHLAFGLDISTMIKAMYKNAYGDRIPYTVPVREIVVSDYKILLHRNCYIPSIALPLMLISPRCECLRGFVPKFPDRWKAVDWSSGCIRKTELECRTKVGFMKYSSMKLPDTRYSKYDMKISLEECARLCLNDCNFTAYANVDIRSGGSGCILWFNDLIDINGYTADGQDIYVKMPASELEDSLRLRAEKPMWIIPISLVLTVLIALLFLLVLRKRKRTEEDDLKLSSETVALNKIESEDWELPLVDFKRIVKATDNFSQDNKLGEGGFGPVYKGMLNDGKEIAMKRLSAF